MIRPSAIVSSTLLVLLVLVVAWGAYTLRSIFVLLFFAFIAASALSPIVQGAARKFRIPRPITITFLYLTIFGVLSLLLAIILPPLVGQSAQLITKLSQLVGVQELAFNGMAQFDFTQVASSVSRYSSLIQQFQGSVQTAVQVVFSTFSAVFITITFLIVTTYLMLSLEDAALSFAWMLPGKKSEQKRTAQRLLAHLQMQLGGWVRGQIFLMLVIGIVSYLGLSLLGVPYALPLAILAGLMEILPNLGPTLSAIPAILVAFFLVNPFIGGCTLLLYIIVQQFENNFIVPQIMKGAVDVRPLTTIILMLVGFKLLGVIGALMILPAYITLRTIVRELWPDRGPFTEYKRV